jgi:hypothetical protein
MFASSQEGTVKRSTRPRKTANLSESLHRQLNSYALAASAAGVSLLAQAQPAEAKIVYTHVHHRIEPGHTYHLDLVGRGVTDFSLVNYAVRWCDGLSAYCFGLEQTAPRKNSVMGYYSGDHGTWDSALVAGRRIGPHLNFHPEFGDLASGFSSHLNGGGTRLYGQWVDVEDRYLGLRFMIKGRTHYGWARMSVEIKGMNLTATLTGYAYETIPNKPIIAGKTKGPDVVTIQPASLGHLAHGASAIPAWRGANPVAATH